MTGSRPSLSDVLADFDAALSDLANVEVHTALHFLVLSSNGQQITWTSGITDDDVAHVRPSARIHLAEALRRCADTLDPATAT